MQLQDVSFLTWKMLVAQLRFAQMLHSSGFKVRRKLFWTLKIMLSETGTVTKKNSLTFENTILKRWLFQDLIFQKCIF